MEALSLLLQPYKGIIGSVAAAFTIAQFFSGAFVCRDIYKRGSTDGIPPYPFIGGIVVGFLMLQYAMILEEIAMFVVNITNVTLNIAYVMFYFTYAKRKIDVFKPASIGLIILAVLIGYAQIEQEELVEFRFGLIVTILLLALIGSPLVKVKHVIKTKDSTVIPFPIVLSGTVVSFLWLLYGLILRNDFMVFQNIIGLGLCIAQVALCFLYPAKEVIKKD